MSDWSELPDLASRQVGGSVVAASDELFAERENLIKDEAPVYRTHTFNNKGQVYDGWETRRRRDGSPGPDWALIRLGIAGVPVGIVVDTAYFIGNFTRTCRSRARACQDIHRWTSCCPQLGTPWYRSPPSRVTPAISSP
jgi:allantoicase